MRTETLKAEAQVCRLQAQAYRGRPEAMFLLRVAGAFEELALQPGEVKADPRSSRG